MPKFLKNLPRKKKFAQSPNPASYGSNTKMNAKKYYISRTIKLYQVILNDTKYNKFICEC